MWGIKMAVEEEKSSKPTTFAAIYARTSSPNQKFNYSIKEQVRQCWDFCHQRGWIVKYVFIDEAQSGGTVERPKFQLMLEKAKEGEFNVIVFWKLDRFCRSLVDLVNIERMLRQWNVGLCSVTEFIDTTTPVGRFNFRNLANVAELERELIGERARLGLYALAREGKWPNPHPPLGYDKDEDGCLVINQTEAELVKKIFQLYLNYKSLSHVAYLLNKEGIRTKRGKVWNARAIRDILANKLYIGEYDVAGANIYIGEYRIIDDETFNAVQKLRARFAFKGSKRPPMPPDEKMEKIEKIISRYRETLKMQNDIRFSGAVAECQILV
jgi:site-specific DNA recombinase